MAEAPDLHQAAQLKEKSIAAVISDGALPPARTFPRISRATIFTIPGRNLDANPVLDLVFPRNGSRDGADILFPNRNISPTGITVRGFVVHPVGIVVLRIPGERDRTVPTERARQALSVIPDNRKQLIVIPKAVHDTILNTAPTLYASTVSNFL
jgi:pimeloyl-ACP methyl ester carboxylesterase